MLVLIKKIELHVGFQRLLVSPLFKQIKSEKYISAPGKSIILLIYRMQLCCAACGLRLSFK